MDHKQCHSMSVSVAHSKSHLQGDEGGIALLCESILEQVPSRTDSCKLLAVDGCKGARQYPEQGKRYNSNIMSGMLNVKGCNIGLKSNVHLNVCACMWQNTDKYT